MVEQTDSRNPWSLLRGHHHYWPGRSDHVTAPRQNTSAALGLIISLAGTCAARGSDLQPPGRTAEIVGISDQSMRRWREQYEGYGQNGLLDCREASRPQGGIGPNAHLYLSKTVKGDTGLS